MANMAVRYSRGNYALQTWCAELTARWGKPARPYEYVTGYLAADNFTGHNADNNGVVHGVDIFVGPGNLSPANADIATAFLRKEGLKGPIPGHPDRLYYIIYQDRIAGDFSGWEWVGAGYGHWDHIHISTCDLFWGDPAPIGALDYDSTAPWGINTTAGQGSGSTPIIDILEGPMGIPKDNLLQIVKALQSKEFGTWMQKTVMNATAPSADGKNWTLSSHLKGTAVRTVQLVKDVAAVRGDIAGVKNQMAQLADKTGVQIDTALVSAAAKEGATAALAEAQAVDAKLIADAVVDEAAARLAGGTE